jgi:acyl-[acyl-carrier-protein] desaturase
LPSGQVLLQSQLEVLESLQKFVGENMMLQPIGESWQPSDYLPDLTAPNWIEQIQSFRGPAAEVSDELLVVLVADMITEEALPSYAVALNHLAQDDTGCMPTPWATWSRGWTSEENRHGDLLNAYLRLTGRVDMASIERTIHHLISSGFEPRAYPDLYGGLIYTAFQERATKISHANVGKLVGIQGEQNLTRICQKIAADEARHEAFYTRIMKRVFELDPVGALMTCRSMFKRAITMPGRKMYDGQDPDLFEHFAIVAQRLGVYTIHDYTSILVHLIKAWDIGSLPVSGAAARAQDYICDLPMKYERVADEVETRMVDHVKVPFSWIKGRSV